MNNILIHSFIYVTLRISNTLMVTCTKSSLKRKSCSLCFRVFAETCVAYAAQLTDCGEYIKAASYLLAVHKVEEAILLLAENHLYKEALAIAKSRYPEDDPTITMVLQNWGKYSSNNGQLLLGAHW